MHILIIPSWYKSITEPVLGTFFEEQARALIKASHQVGIIYPQLAPVSAIFGKKDEINEFYNDNGLPTFSFIYQSKVPKLRDLIYKKFASRVERVYNVYQEQFGKPDIIHTHSVFHGGIAAFYISKKKNIPLVITEHLTAFMNGSINHKADIDLSSDIFSSADASIIVSHNFKSDIEKALNLPANTFTVIHNMVADLFFENVTEKKYSTDEEFLFFTNSFLLPRKNHKLIFEAIKILTDRGKKVRLKVGGDGPLKEELIMLSSNMGLADSIDFLGALSRHQVKEEVDACHAFVLSSLYETFGVVLIESFACGRPVVVTDSGGPRDFVTDQNGILVKEFDATKFADAMQQVMENYTTYNQLEISKNCYALFHEKKIGGEIENLYKNILQGKKSNTPRVS